MQDLETARNAAMRALDRLEQFADRARPRLSNFERGAKWRRHQAELKNLPGLEILPPESPEHNPKLVLAHAPPVPPPALPAALEKWVKVENDPRIEPQPATSRKRRVPPVEAAGLVKARLARAKNLGKVQPDGLRSVELFFDDDSPAKRKWARYREEWREWQQREAPRRAASSAYDQLLEMLPAIRGDDDAGQPLEVVVGIGLARLRPECNCAVAEIPAEMWIGESDEIIIRPRGKPILALPHFAESPERILVAEIFAETLKSAREINPFNPEFLAPVLKAARDHLATNARHAEDSYVPGEEMPAELTLFPNWFIAVRPREDSSVLKKIIAGFRQELEAAKTTEDIPEILLRAAFGPEAESDENASAETSPPAPLSHPLSPPLSHPLPCNPEQAEVLAKMANPEKSGMAILAPASSGATRTLANLACQTLAQGGRMLAVSRERAHLADLLEALPESVRRLAAAPLFGESENRRQIAAAARAAAQLAAETDPDKTASDLARDESERESILREIAELEAQNAQAAAPHFAPVAPLFAEILPRPSAACLAQWAADHAEKFNWFTDHPPAPEFPPEIEDMLTARAALGAHLSPPKSAADEEKSAQNKEGEDDTVWVLEHPDRAAELNLPSAPAPEEPLPQSVAAVAEKMLADRKEAEKINWIAGLLEDFLTDPDFAPAYRRRRAELRIFAARRKMAAGVRHPDLEAAATPATIAALTKKSSPLRFWIPVRDHKTRKVLEGFRLEGRRPHSIADWRKIRAFAKWLEDFGKFAKHWNREAAADIGDKSARIPDSAAAHPSWVRKAEEGLQKMESVLRCAEFLRGEVFRIVEGVERAGAPKWAAMLRTSGGAPLPKDWRDAWRWGCAKSALAKLEEDSAAADASGVPIDSDLREKRADLAALDARISERRTALAICQMARPEWARATAEDAEKILPEMPLVIAPSWRANEWLPARFGIFDAVAADGGSMSPAAELTLLLRGKRAAVFGDDRRFAPAVFGEELSGAGTGGGGSEDFLRASDSLYDFARRAWPADAGFLREVYGSAWPLAETVSRLFYDGKLYPVFFPEAGERLGAPLTGIWVKRGVLDGGRNEGEARALMGELERIVADPRTAARSAGLAALSEEQADFARAAAEGRFGEEVLSGRDFVCDDAEGWGAGGGGKRRDIALVSLADSPGRGDGLTTARARRRLNLALGVGRLQLRLAHSISRDDLRDAGDLRRELLGRFYARGADKLDGRETEEVSEFERDLCARLRDAGYVASLGAGAPGLRAGVAVEGENGARLGAELDGGREEDWDAAQLRRARLARGGWRFWRAFAADYMLHPERVLTDLRAKLSEAGIHPWNGEPPLVAETRVYSPVEEE